MGKHGLRYDGTGGGKGASTTCERGGGTVHPAVSSRKRGVYRDPAARGVSGVSCIVIRGRHIYENWNLWGG